jgi:hypothetical protein
MTHTAVIIGHADGDGHLIAEQTRRNLSETGVFDLTVVVDQARTQGHKSWLKLDRFSEIESAEFVFFVDLMFGPKSFAEEASALVEFVNHRSEKHFFLIDHHPLPLERLAPANNLRVLYRPDVSQCVLGPQSGMMVVAALCERQIDEVAEIRTSAHDALAVGMRRAAAHGGPLVGEKLLALLRADQWEGLFRLGSDDRQFHYLPHGFRPAGHPQSDALRELDQTASQLLAQGDESNYLNPARRTAMAYDIDVGQQELSYDAGRPRLIRNASNPSKDLGVIITLLELAALSLTTEPGATFTLEELIREAREYAGDGVQLDERDIKIVLNKRSFLEKVGSDFRLK